MRPRGAAVPEMAFSNVVLPAPLGPTSVTNSPSATSRDRSTSARRPPYETPSAAMASTSARPPVSETGEPIGQLEQRLHRVLDDHHRHAGGPHAPDHRDHHVDAVGRE